MKSDFTKSRIFFAMLVLTAVAALNAFDGASLMAMDVQIENTVLEVTIASETGRMSVLQKATGILWEQELTLPNSQSVADFQVNRGQNVISYSLTVVEGQPQPLELTVELALIGDEPSIDVTLASKGGAYVEMHHFGYPAPLYPTTPENYFLALPEFGNGRYVSVSDPRYRLHCKVSEMPTRQPHESSFTRGWFETFWGLLMPWVAVTDGEQGMIVVAMTPWDAVIATQARANDEAGLSFPGSVWEPSKNIWGEDRKVRLAFFETGGHVAACKIYREIAKQQGYVRTLADKAMVRPDVEKLMGAVDWWGAAGKDQGIQWNAAITPLPFVKEAIAEGIDRGLVERLPQRGKWAPEEIAGVVQRGWLASTYDNYRDITDDPGWLSAFPGPINYCVALPIEDYAAVGGDGEIMPGWFSFRLNCTEKQLERAQVIIPEALETYPYNARFLDVTASEELVECYSPVHPTTRRSDQANREQLLNYVSEDVKIVTGAELGRFFSVPNVDYHMGTMMAEFLMGWGTSSLSDPRNRDELGEDYLAYGLNPAVRAPLFELVFHDCVVNYWWWGDSSEFLHGVAPELTDRKTAMNIIHGTPPQMWPYEHSLHWDIPQERELMLTIYRNVCKLHEIIGMQEMASHTFLTPDRMVQQTVFTDGTTCTVNFGAATYSVASGREQGRVFDLGENDFYVVGPEIEQWRACDGGSSHRTVIRTDTYYSVESGTTLYHDEMLSSAGTVTVKKDDAEQAHIRLAAGSSLTLDVLSWQPNWANLPRIVVRLDNLGQPIDRIKGSDSDIITLVTPVEKCSYLLLVGSKALAPDIETLNDSGLDSWPASGMVFEGAQAEGPYLDPGRDKIVLVNNSLFPINWTAGESESWHQLSPSSGTIAAYGTADVSVTVPAAVARAMSVGTYTSVITVNDTTNGVSHDSAMELRIGPSPSPALSINGSFEDGTLGWAGYSTDYYGLGDGTTTRTGWTFTGGEGRWLIGPPDSAGKTTDGDYCLSPSTTGGSFDLSQTFSVIDGMTYEVTFDAADWGNSYKGTEPGAYMTVACGGSSQTVYKTDYTADADFHGESFQIVASGSTATMQITAVSVYGFLLDNVNVVSIHDYETDPPAPTIATFAVAPFVSGLAISMTATTGTDATGPVEYYFDEVSGKLGGSDSGWQQSPIYTDTGLLVDTEYTYTVTMRDGVWPANIGTTSAPASAIATTGILNGSFEDGTLGALGYSTGYYGLGDGATTRTGWTFIGGEGRWLIGPPDSAGKTTDGGYSISPSNTGGSFDLSQTFDVIDGTTYEVTFDAADWGNSYKGTEPGAYMTVACGGSSQTVYKTDYTADADFHSESFRFTASGDSATMQITAVSVYGFLLDNITVLEVLAGDFEPVGGDGDVDSADLLYFAQRWLNTGCDSPDWCDGADLDKQGGIVDLRDFAIFAENWLK